MARKVKEFVPIKDYSSLDDLIEKATQIRDSLPPGAEPELKMVGDDVFGRLLYITYFRPQTDEEAECEARYAQPYRQSHAFILPVLRFRPVSNTHSS